MDLAKGSMCLPNEIGILVGKSVETALKVKLSATEKLWVTRGDRWVPTVIEGLGRTRYMKIANLGERILRLDHRLHVGMVLDQEKVPRYPGFVSVGSRRYMEWQNLALEATVDEGSTPLGIAGKPSEPVVERPTYPTPRSILRRSDTTRINGDLSSISTLEARSRVQTSDLPEVKITFAPQDEPVNTSPYTISLDRTPSGDAGAERDARARQFGPQIVLRKRGPRKPRQTGKIRIFKQILNTNTVLTSQQR